MRRSALILLAGSLTLFSPARATAQERTPTKDDAAALRALTAHGSTAQERDRTTVRAFLGRDDVRRTAEAHGIDVEKLQEGVATLDSADAADLADRVRTAQSDLAQVGGDTFVITSTTIIIVLLLAILIIVA